MIVRNKVQMYRMLETGAFGNTTNQYFTIDDWKNSEEYRRYSVWGVRSLAPGGPCRLFCPRDEVESTVLSFNCSFNISVMVDAVSTVRLWAEIMDTPIGLSVYAIQNPKKGASWRKEMPSGGCTCIGLAALMLLQRYLTPSSLADLKELLVTYPGHVVELSVFDRCMGSIPGRNAIIWEVRHY